jgi:integrase
MSIRKRGDGAYQVRTYIVLANGKERYEYTTVYGTEEEAKLVDAKLKVKYGRGARVPGNPTVEEFFNRWLEDYIKPPFKRPKTYQNYEMHTRLRIIPGLGSSTKLKRVTPGMIQRMYRNMRDGRVGRIKPGHDPEPLSDRTIHGCHRVLRTGLQQAVDEGIIDENPALKVKPPQLEKYKPVMYTPEQLEQFLMTAQNHRLYALFNMAAFTGLRLGEDLGLTWSDFDEETKTVRVCRIVQSISKRVAEELGSDTVYLAEYAKSDDSLRYVLLIDRTVEALKQHRIRQHKERLKQGNKYKNQGLIFATRRGGLLGPRYVNRLTKQICAKAGLPPIRFHDLRHTHFQMLANAGIGARDMADRAGHSDPGFTMRTYTHPMPTAQQKSVDVLNEQFPGTPRRRNYRKLKRV